MKSLQRVLFFCLLGLSACVSIDGVDVYSDSCLDSQDENCQLNEREQWIINVCSLTANSYPYYRDRLLYHGYGELFTENATFQIGDHAEIKGKTAIVEALRSRGSSATTRHFSQVVNMQAVDENTARGVSYLNLYSAKTESQDILAGSKKKQAIAPLLIAEYHDTFKIKNRRCLIDSRKVVIIFMGD